MHLKRVVLTGQPFTTTLKALLPKITEHPPQAYHEFMYQLVEAIRYRDKAMQNIVALVKSLDYNLGAENYHPMRPHLVANVKELAMSMLFQAEDYELYDRRSVLMYTYFRHPDYSFDDVMITSILPLTWNGHLYEPPVL